MGKPNGYIDNKSAVTSTVYKRDDMTQQTATQTRNEIFVRMQLCGDGVIRAIYRDHRGEFVRISGQKIRRF